LVTSPCSGYDVANVSGIATLGNATLNIVPSYTPNAGQVFTILTASSVVGTYNGLPDNSLITVSGLKFRINYTATNVTLTFVSGTLTPANEASQKILAVFNAGKIAPSPQVLFPRID